jgi:hypothetical protein
LRANVDRRHDACVTYFFAYGDRMGTERMRAFAPGAQVVGPAKVQGYRLAFNVHSRAWGGGAANAIPDARSSMWGVLWDLGDEDPTMFDSFKGDEGTGHGVLDITAEGPDGAVAAKTLAVSAHEVFVRPNARYLAMLRAIAEQQGLPEEALAAIDRAAEGPQGRAPSI